MRVHVGDVCTEMPAPHSSDGGIPVQKVGVSVWKGQVQEEAIRQCKLSVSIRMSVCVCVQVSGCELVYVYVCIYVCLCVCVRENVGEGVPLVWTSVWVLG